MPRLLFILVTILLLPLCLLAQDEEQPNNLSCGYSPYEPCYVLTTPDDASWQELYDWLHTVELRVKDTTNAVQDFQGQSQTDEVYNFSEYADRALRLSLIANDRQEQIKRTLSDLLEHVTCDQMVTWDYLPDVDSLSCELRYAVLQLDRQLTRLDRTNARLSDIYDELIQFREKFTNFTMDQAADNELLIERLEDINRTLQGEKGLGLKIDDTYLLDKLSLVDDSIGLLGGAVVDTSNQLSEDLTDKLEEVKGQLSHDVGGVSSLLSESDSKFFQNFRQVIREELSQPCGTSSNPCYSKEAPGVDTDVLKMVTDNTPLVEEDDGKKTQKSRQADEFSLQEELGKNISAAITSLKNGSWQTKPLVGSELLGTPLPTARWQSSIEKIFPYESFFPKGGAGGGTSCGLNLIFTARDGHHNFDFGAAITGSGVLENIRSLLAWLFGFLTLYYLFVELIKLIKVTFTFQYPQPAVG